MPVSDAARIMLSRVFKEVRQNLVSAAKFADEDIENVHRLRISTRRTVAALEVFREFLPANRLLVIAQQLTQIRDAAGTARDLDVLIQSQSKASKQRRKLVKQLKKDRKKAQTPIAEAYKQAIRQNSFRNDCRSLLKALDRIDTDNQPSFENWASLKLAIYVSRFFSQRPVEMSDLRKLHRFRIEAKKFRYILGVLKPALPPKAIKKLRPNFRRLQDEIGKINDHAVAISRIRKLKQKGVKIDKQMAKQEQAQLNASIERFAKWWTEETANSLQKRFESSFLSAK